MLASAAVESLGHIDLALIAHGIIGDQEAVQEDYLVAENIFQTNFLSAVSLSTWLANYFEARKDGVLAVISSVAGDRGRKSNYVYGASKGALNIFLRWSAQPGRSLRSSRADDSAGICLDADDRALEAERAVRPP